MSALPSRPSPLPRSPRRPRRSAPRSGVSLAAPLLAAALLLSGCSSAPAVSEDQFKALAAQGSVAQVTFTLSDGPGKPTADPQQVEDAYGGIAACDAYYAGANQNLVNVFSGTSAGDELGVSEVRAELWASDQAAADALAQWPTCAAAAHEAKLLPGPALRVADEGHTGNTFWQYAEVNDLTAPVHQLTLREHNLMVTFELPEAPAPDLRDQFVQRFHDDVAALG